MPLQVSRIQAICFDVDGTLSDTDDQMTNRLERWLHPFSFLFPRRDTLRVARRLVMTAEAPANFLLGIPDILGLDTPLFKLYEKTHRLLGHRKKRDFLLIEGTRAMLQELGRRFPLAVVSARDEASTRAFLEQFDLHPFFRCVATAQTCEHTKPYPDPILWAAERMGVPADTCLMVGDTTVDMRAGCAAGAQRVGVLCGFGERRELEKRGADLILSFPVELVQVLQE